LDVLKDSQELKELNSSGRVASDDGKNTTHSLTLGREDPVDLQKISKAMSRISSIEYFEILEYLIFQPCL